MIQSTSTSANCAFAVKKEGLKLFKNGTKIEYTVNKEINIKFPTKDNYLLTF